MAIGSHSPLPMVVYTVPFTPSKSPLKVWPQPTHPLLARVQLALTFLWAAVPIPLIFAVIYIVFKGNIR